MFRRRSNLFQQHMNLALLGMCTLVSQERDALAEANARLEAELTAKKATKPRRRAKSALTKAELEDAFVQAMKELKRWRDGEIVCQRVVDVETGAVTTEAQEAKRGGDEPRTKRPRQDDRGSLLSQLVQVKTEAAQETTRLQNELEDATLCTLCLENPRDIYFDGCGHCLSCAACADLLLGQHGGTRMQTNAPCPVCRQPIIRMRPFKLV